MGRKGIGKLSLFSIAKRIEVASTTPKKGKSHLRLDADDIRTAITEHQSYHPRSLPLATTPKKHGTRIVLRNLKLNLTAATKKALRRRLARRFSVIGPKQQFVVAVDGKPIGLADRDYFKSIEFLWSIGNVGNEYATLCVNATKKKKLPGDVSPSKGYEIKGWIGTFDERKSIVDEENNTLSVLAWGKLVHEDLLEALGVGGIYSKYLIGELRADFLDLDQEPDIATTDRQHLKEDDPRFSELQEFVRRQLLRPIEDDWNEWRSDNAMTRALEVPAVKEWYEDLPSKHRTPAKQLFGKIGRLPVANDDTRREIYRHAILAFERLRFKDALDTIDKIQSPADFAILEAVFGDIEDLEALQYHDIARGRFELLQKFVGIAETEKEKVIQNYLFDNIWLLDPSWERGSTNLRVEQVVTKEFGKLDAKLSPAEKLARFDIKYRTAAGKHIIIELKRYGVAENINDLMKQLMKYRTALGKVLEKKFPKEPRLIECVLVLGTKFAGASGDEGSRMLSTINARWTTYDTLIEDSVRSYGDYIKAQEKVSKLSDVLDRIASGA
jgi:hypothetical protein